MAQVAAVTSNLIFSTRITGTAQAVGAECAVTASASALGTALQGGGVRLVLVDMECPQAVECITVAAHHSARPKVVAFYAHVHVDQAEAARAAGADDVMPRSRFTRELPGLMASFSGR